MLPTKLLGTMINVVFSLLTICFEVGGFPTIVCEVRSCHWIRIRGSYRNCLHSLSHALMFQECEILAQLEHNWTYHVICTDRAIRAFLRAFTFDHKCSTNKLMIIKLYILSVAYQDLVSWKDLLTGVHAFQLPSFIGPRHLI
jgi:hypothetical protein